MTKLMKLSVIALLTGALGLVGCGDDDGGGGTGGSGAIGGSGGTACEQTCGAGNELPNDATTDTEIFTCNLMEAVGVGLDIGLEMNFAGLQVTQGSNTYDLTFQNIISPAAVTLIEMFATEGTIVDAIGTVTPLSGTSEVTKTAAITLAPVPCTVCFEAGIANVVTLPAVQETWTVSSGAEAQVLELSAVTVVIDAGDLIGELSLSNVGDSPACFWGTDSTAPADPPALTFDVSGTGGAGGTGGTGGPPT